MSIKYNPEAPKGTPGYRVNDVSEPCFATAYNNDTDVSPNAQKVTLTLEGQMEWQEAVKALKAYRF